MFRKDQIDDIRTRPVHFFGMRMHTNRLPDSIRTGSLQKLHSLDFHDTNAAQTAGFQIRMVAQRRNMDSCSFCRFKDCRPWRNPDLLFIDDDINQILTLAGLSSGYVASLILR